MPSASFAAAESYYIAPSGLNSAFQIMDRGASNVFGMFQNGIGKFSFDPDKATISNLKIALETGSMMAPNGDAIHDLETLFDVDTYPEMSFMATAPVAFEDGHARISGTLTVHGQSKPADFDATLNSTSEDSSSVGLSLRGSFKRADFAMADAPEIPGRFGDTMTLMLEIRSIRN